MDVQKLSSDSHEQLADLGDSFVSKMSMGELSELTDQDIKILGSTIQTAVEIYRDRGMTDEQIAEALQLDGDVHMATDQVFARFVMTIDQYAHLGNEQSAAALEYINTVCQAVKRMDGIFHDLQLSDLFSQTLHFYGQGAKNFLDLQKFLDERFLARVSTATQNRMPHRHDTADYTKEISPREYVARSFAKTQGGTVTKTLMGIAAQNPTPPAVIVTQREAQLDFPATARRNTELGLGYGLENKGGFVGPVVDIPRHSPPPQIDISNSNGLEPDLDLDEPTISMSTTELLAQEEPDQEITRVSSTFTMPIGSTGAVHADEVNISSEDSEQSTPPVEATAAVEKAIVEIPAMPPAPELLEPSRRHRPVIHEQHAFFDTPPPSEPTIQTAVLEATEATAKPEAVEAGPVRTVNKEAGPRTTAETIPDDDLPMVKPDPMALPDDLVLPSQSYRPGHRGGRLQSRTSGNRAEAIEPRYIPAPNAPAITHLPKIMVGQQDADQQPAASATPSTSISQPVPKKMEPIAPPKDLKLPSSYRPSADTSKSKSTETPVTRPPANTPTATVKQTRSKVWKWAAAAAAAAGMAGLFGSMYFSGNQENNGTDSNNAVSSATTASPKTPDQKVSSSDQDNKIEEKDNTDRGVFRVNTSHPAFAAYLCEYKQASGLISKIKSSAANAKVHYYGDSEAREQAKARYKHILSGQETEEQQRIIMMTVFLEDALANSADNAWLVGFFKKHQAGLEEFVRTGQWNHKALSVGADKLYNAIQKPEKLTTSPNIIGYAPNVNPDTNPAILKVKAGAPTFYQIMREVGAKMQASTNPEDLAPFDDFRSIKDITCQRILKAGLASKDADTRSGISYMHRQWCKEECSPNNEFNQALRATVPVYAETPAPAPQPTQAPNNIVPNSAPANTAPAPVHTRLESIETQQKHAALEKKPGFLQRAASKVKSIFGFGKKAAPVETQTATAQEYTRKDLPMYTWKETLKQYFWG